MIFGDSMTTGDVLRAFENEIALRGGEVIDHVDDETRLFARSTLPAAEEVRVKDRVRGGVAIRASGGEVWVHPYVFRMVCSNGAIMATAVQTRHVILAEVGYRDAVEVVREAVAVCCEREAFAASAQLMRSATDRATDMLLSVMSHLSRLPAATRAGLMQKIMENMAAEAGQTRFTLMNAVTATARDTRDPELKWRLEELGGAIAANTLPRPRPNRGVASAMRRPELVA